MDDVPYLLLRCLLRILFPAVFRLRAHGRERVRATAALFVSNHQSFLDPMLVGAPIEPVLHFMARRSLFIGPFGWAIRLTHAFPVERERADVRAVRDTLDLLRRGKSVLIFPEGTRTRNGRLGPLRSGAGLIARRAGVCIQPVYIDGAFRAWPVHRWLPLPATIHLWYGAALSVETEEDERRTMDRLESAMLELEAGARDFHMGKRRDS